MKIEYIRYVISAILAIGSLILALSGIEGWGWVLFASIIII